MRHGSPITAGPAYRPFPDEGGRNWRQEHLEIPLMLRALGVPRGGRVLEVGCGRGIALPVLARRIAPAHLAGVDVDAELIGIAKHHVRDSAVRADLTVADVRALPFPDRHFDVVIDFGTCFHLAGAEAALREIARVITPGGIFVTEMKLGQLLSHPMRSRGRSLPWDAVPMLVPLRSAFLWESRRRVAL